MKEQYKKYSEIISLILVVVAALVLARIFTVFVFQSYIVDGSSMETALQNKDRLIVNKYKATAGKITHKPYVPKRYDIIVFNHTDSYSLSENGTRQLIKRVIGLPGDHVVVKSGTVKIYNTENPHGLEVDNLGPEKDEITVQQTGGNVDLTVKDGEVFVLGDNRNNSLDSRIFGTINQTDIVGKANLRFYPFKKTGKV